MTTSDPVPGVDPVSFQKGHVPEDTDADLEGLRYVLDEQDRAPGIVRLRDWTVERLAPAPGETAVDVGCGTGAEVRRLAGLVGPSGRAVGVEPHAGLRAEAQARAEEEGSTAEFVDGDALDLPFADGSVDVLRCERVFQHLPDPDGAAREIARVLAPGGRTALVDSDWATMVATPADPDVLRRYNESFWRRLPNPFAGRHLALQLRHAGLSVDPDVGSAAMVMPESFLQQPAMLRLQAEQAVEAGDLTAEEAEQLIAGLAEAAGRGEAFAAVTLFAAVAIRPRRPGDVIGSGADRARDG